MKTKTSTQFLLRTNKSNFLLLISLFLSVYAFSASVTFNGTTNTDWAEPTNWSTGTVPTSADVITITSNKSVVIAIGTSVSVERITLNAGTTSLTNYGTLTISPISNTGSALTLQGNGATFDNEGTLTVTSANQTTASSTITINGNSTAANSLIFNGSTTLAAKSGVSVFVIGTGATGTIGGTGFTVGSAATPSVSTVFSFTSGSGTSADPSITISNGTTITIYIGGSANGIYLGGASSLTNNGTLYIYPGTGITGTSVHAIQLWETTASKVCAFTNNGTLTTTGFAQPTVFGGSTSYGTFTNTGTATITSSDVSGALALYAGSSLAYQFSNSGTLNLYGYANAIKLSPNAASQTFTNTGTINITKGSITSSGTSGTTSTYPTLNNNSGGVINFNYGVPVGTTTATSTVLLNNNSGATINGSCTFAASTLATAVGSTLSPGDYTGGVSGIGTIVLTPSATGTKFPLYGNLVMKIIGKTTAGIDFDKLSCTELDVTNASMTVTADYTSYTPAVSDYIVLDYSGTSKTGPFSSTSMPRGWIYETTTTNEAAKYYPSLPGAPISVVATSDNAQASVAFTAPASDGGADITSYTVTSSPGSFTGTGSSSPILVTGLTNGTAYTFTVTATNIKGTSSASVASNSVTPTVATFIATVENNPLKFQVTASGLILNLSDKVTSNIQIMDLSGRIIEQRNAKGQILIAENLKGIYIIKVKSDEKIYNQKIKL